MTLFKKLQPVTWLLLTALVVVAGLWVAQHLGFNAVVAWPLDPVVLSTAAILGVWLISVGLHWLGETLHAGRFAWQRRLRRYLGVEKDHRMHEADWIGMVLQLLLWLSLPLLILQCWGLSETSLRLLSKFAWTGFSLGGKTQVVPGQLLLGIVLFAALITFIRWLAGRLEHKWLARTPLEQHTRETVATLFAYLAFVLAGLVGLDAAGFNLANLALIAGALSVGIGFGLQNVVSNFISGVILMFERPIRTGDYITVDETEGYVRRMRIRSTEIETLDRMTIIVPNSQLLTHHVKNWNLRDHYGRVAARVGVAYGSDTELVKNLLMQVASEHPLVVQKGETNVPGPMIFFANIGGSTLNFELKVFVRQISMRFVVVSDLNFAIDAIFREHGVSMAFPQQDVWFRNAIPKTED